MKIVFMGTPEFAVPSLQRILQSDHKVELVVSAPDKERGRGRELSPTPVKEFAIQNGLEVLTPANLKEENFIQRLKEVDADLFVIVAFGILPKEVYTIPKRGSFNLHGSLLPKYRGAAPIQWAIINGEKETGVTTFFLEERVDTGNIILQEKLIINDDDDCGIVHDRMMLVGADVVLKTVELIDKCLVEFQKQDNSLATPAPKITKELCLINWNSSAEKIHNLARGLAPYPAAFFLLDGKQYKVYKTKVVGDIKFAETDVRRRENFIQTKNEIYVQTGFGILQILELQPEGRKRMTAEEFLRGYKIA